MTILSKKGRILGAAALIVVMGIILTYYGLYLEKSRENIGNIVVSCVLLLISYLLYVTKWKANKINLKRAFTVVMFVLVPVLTVTFIWNFQPGEGRFFLFMQNVILLLILQAALFFVFFKIKPVLIICTGINWFFFLVDDVVMVLRKTPLVPADVISLRTALSVSGNYTFKISSGLIFATCAMIFIMILAIRVPMEANLAGTDSKKAGKAAVRIGALVITCLLAFYADTWQRADFQADNFDVANMNENNGTVLTFYLNFREMTVTEPDGFNKEEVKAELASYEDKTASISNSGDMPNVIIIMDEAFSDLSILGDLQTNQDPLEFCHSLEKQDNVISGHLNVSVWGGSTCNTEFEVLTGNTLEMLPYGSIPYMQYVSENTDSLCNYFHKLGYTNIAIHPYWGQCWRRDTVYEQFGFDKFIDAEDFDSDANTKDISDIAIHEGVNFGNSLDYVRNYISDEESFAQIRNQFEKKKEGEKLFLLNVTMQNHGGYLYSGDNFAETVQCGRVNDSRVNQYLSLIDKTDDALKNLIEYFNNVDEPTVILFFGDHQPGLDKTFYEEMFGRKYEQFTNNDFRLRYTVPYYIWANYELNDVEYDEVSANYLSMVLKDAAGLPFDSWDTFRSEVYKEFPVMTSRLIVDKYNVLSVRGTVKSDLLDQYNKFQYYRLFQYDQ